MGRSESRTRHAALVAGLVLLAAAPARAGDAARGELIAATWCASCHAENGRAIDAVPGLVTLTRRRRLDTEALARALLAPHPPMPPLALSNADIADIAAYLDAAVAR